MVESDASIHDTPRLEGKVRFLSPPGSATLAVAHNGTGDPQGIERG